MDYVTTNIYATLYDNRNNIVQLFHNNILQLFHDFREQVLEKLQREELGAFIIRESSTHRTCFALSVKVPKFNNATGIAHYIIHRTPSQGFKIKVRKYKYCITIRRRMQWTGSLKEDNSNLCLPSMLKL